MATFKDLSLSDPCSQLLLSNTAIDCLLFSVCVYYTFLFSFHFTLNSDNCQYNEIYFKTQ